MATCPLPRGRPRLTPELKLRALMKRKEKQKLYEHESMILLVSSQVKTRWESVKRIENLETNNEVANYLLDLWENTRSSKLLEIPVKWSETSQFTPCIAEAQLESSSIPVLDTPESNESMTESSVEIKVENFEKDADDTSYLTKDSETDKEINEIVNHAKGLNTRIKLTDEDTENFTNNENRRKSCRVQTRGFRPNYASLDWEESSDSDSENIKDDVNNVKQDIKLEVEDQQNCKSIDNVLNDFSDKVENALNERMRNLKKKKISKEEDPDFIVSDDDAKILSDSEESIDINVRDSCDDGTPKDVQNENLGKKESNASKQKLYRKRKKDERERSKKPWVHIKLEDHQEKYRIETVGNFERKNRNNNLTEELYTCLLCGRFKSTAKDIFEEHIEKHVNMVLQCDQCNYVGRSEIEIMRHKSNTGHMRKGSEYMCDICGMVLFTWDSRLSHMGKVHDDPQFKCKFCEEKYVTRIKRQQHMRAIHADITQYCNKCKKDQRSLSQEEFRKHQESCKPGHQCQVCGLVLASKSGVTSHLKFIHMGVRKYQCQLCQYAGKSKQRLREHVMTHNSVHPYSCDKCPFTCVQAYQLKSHMRTHSGEKPFKCTQCKFAAAWNVQLKYHMSVHELESSVMCQQCDVLFKNEKALKMHEKKDHSILKNTSV